MFHRHQRCKKHNRKFYDVTSKSTFSFFLLTAMCLYIDFINSIQRLYDFVEYINVFEFSSSDYVDIF